jgi:hypothetical protein
MLAASMLYKLLEEDEDAKTKLDETRHNIQVCLQTLAKAHSTG